MVSWIWLIVVCLVTFIVSLVLFCTGVEKLKDESYRDGYKNGYFEAQVEMQKKESKHGQEDKCSENLRDTVQSL